MRGVEAQDLVGPGRSDASVREVHLSGASDKGGRKRRRALHGHPFGHISKKRVRQARFRMPTRRRGDVFTAGGRSVGLGVTTTDDTERAEAFRSEEARKEGRGREGRDTALGIAEGASRKQRGHRRGGIGRWGEEGKRALARWGRRVVELQGHSQCASTSSSAALFVSVRYACQSRPLSECRAAGWEAQGRAVRGRQMRVVRGPCFAGEAHHRKARMAAL